MNVPTREDDFDRAAESFVGRLRAGERPSITEYVRRNPDLADEVLELFPALIEMEAAKADASGTSLAYGVATPADVPERLGDYRILRVIGAGGMGVVYEAERESLQAPVALKVLHHRYRDDPKFHRRFRNEARSAARLHHNNIVPVFDFGDHDGVLYCVMQFVHGQSIDRILDGVRRFRGTAVGDASAPTVADPIADASAATVGVGIGDASALSTLAGSDQPRYHREVARIGAEVAEALAYAHGRGVLHRDIKPSNLLIDARGTAWVTDFGLAKFEGGEDLTAPGDVVGTIRYMPPERFDGHSDARCDIYSLGITLYEMLALRPAFTERERAVLIRQILDGRPKPLRQVVPGISRDLETVIHKTIAHDPAYRYATADELADELRRIVDNRTIRSRRIPVHERLGRWCRRNPVVAGLSASAAILLGLVAVISLWAAIFYRWSNAEARLLLQRAETAEAERSEELMASRLAQARAVRFSRRSGQRFDALDALADAARIGRKLGLPPERFNVLRNEAIAALGLPDIQITQQFGRYAGGTVDVDDDFTLYVATDPDEHCVVRRIDDDAEVARLPDHPTLRQRQVHFGPGRWLAETDAHGAFHAWDLSGPRPVVRVEEPAGVAWWDFRPDGSLLALVHADGSITTYTLPHGERAAELAPGLLATRPRTSRMSSKREPVGRLHPSAPFLIFSDYYTPGVEVRDLRDGSSIPVRLPWRDGEGTTGLVDAESIGEYVPEWTPDGRGFLVAHAHGQHLATFAFNPVNRAISAKTHQHGPDMDFGLVARFHPRGDTLIARPWACLLGLIDVATGRRTFQTMSNGDWDIRMPRIDRAGDHVFPGIVYDADGRGARLGIWSLAVGREARLWTSPEAPGPTTALALSPDGRIALATNIRRLTCYDVATGRDLGGLTLSRNWSAPVPVFDGTGALLIGRNDGLTRWPIGDDPETPGGLVIGPPERLDVPHGYHAPAVSRDGRVIAVAMGHNYGMEVHKGGWLLRRDRQGPAVRIDERSTERVDVSPDGRWVALVDADHHIVVRDAETGAVAWAVSNPVGGHARFSPDGRWLATDGDGGRMYRVGNWGPGPRLGRGGSIVFTPDGAAAFLITDARGVRLVDTADGRELARFEDPDEGYFRIDLTPDGGTLLATHKEGVRAWDLRLIRAGLARLGLDWEAPPIPPAEPPTPLTSVRFVGAEALDRPASISTP